MHMIGHPVDKELAVDLGLAESLTLHSVLHVDHRPACIPSSQVISIDANVVIKAIWCGMKIDRRVSVG